MAITVAAGLDAGAIVARVSTVSDRAEEPLVERARDGDEAAFAELVRRYSPSLLRVARMYVATDADAGDVVQETWLAVLRGLERFEGRSSFKTWLFRILVNRAKTRGVREHRSVPFSSVGAGDGAAGGGSGDDDEPVVDPLRFAGDGRWASPPRRWDEEDPEQALRSSEALRIAREAIDRLPERQRIVITLRDLEGLSSDEVRNALDLSETNQRVLLHRARAKVRQALESWIDA